MKKGYFITGTDTSVGKTYFSVALVHVLRNQGKTVAVMKPVASGGTYDSGELRNEDAQLLLDASGLDIPYELVNPYVFEAPVAPHIAAAENNIKISLPYIVDAYNQLAAKADVVVVEGVGGWHVPLVVDDEPSRYYSMVDLALQLKLPVIMVVGMRLGCLNHALLTAQAIRGSKLKFYAWVANTLEDEMPRYTENIESLKQLIVEPLLAEIPFNATEQSIARLLHKNNL
ncbi:Dethiobiotin synthetase [hydrothermal vent metagenome]|uniref:Dethiobiotin synthetase n=1 Tax=hydrothermal vent metagenome TaxID=652676 RepID=A0A3B0ZSH5_9ZZZZ